MALNGNSVRRLRILAVDDEQIMLDLYRDALFLLADQGEAEYEFVLKAISYVYPVKSKGYFTGEPQAMLAPCNACPMECVAYSIGAKPIALGSYAL